MVDVRVRIVVGFDGSPNSLLAVNWAVAEACLREAVVVLCHVVPCSRTFGGTLEDEVRQAAAERLLAYGVRYASRRTPTVDVAPRLVVGSPAHELVEAAAGATLLVVGARGEGGFPGLRLGSVSAQVARHAPGTVVVVPDRGVGADDHRARQIVVGVDGSTGSSAALAFAFAEAAGRRAQVRAIYVFEAATLQTMAALPHAELRRMHVRAADTLRRMVSAHAQQHPGVEFCCEVMSGAPASTLTAAGAHAELLVLGSRGHGDVATLMLGSTSHTALHNTTCPVAVIRVDRRASATPSHHPHHGSLVRGRS